jgi:hypothetical protein
MSFREILNFLFIYTHTGMERLKKLFEFIYISEIF